MTWVQPVGRDAVIVSQAVPAASEVSWLRRDAATATPVGRAADVVASRDGRGLWLWDQRDGRRCSLRKVGLDGRQRRPARRVDCHPAGRRHRPGPAGPGRGPRPDEPLTVLVDRDDGRRLASYPVVHAVAGDLVLWGNEELDQGPFTLTDRRTGVDQRIPRPSRVGQVEFADPAWDGGPTQLMDVWLLDLGPAAGGSSPACRCWPRSRPPAWPGPATVGCCCWAASTGSAAPSRCGGLAKTGWRSAGSGYRPTAPAPTRSCPARARPAKQVVRRIARNLASACRSLSGQLRGCC